jgi:hypothetical protein
MFSRLLRKGKGKGRSSPSAAAASSSTTIEEDEDFEVAYNDEWRLQLHAKRELVRSTFASGEKQVREIMEENVEAVLDALRDVDKSSASDNGVSIFHIRQVRRLQEQANEHYRPWIDMVESDCRKAVEEFVYAASKETEMSPGSVIMAVHEFTSAVVPRDVDERRRVDFLKDCVSHVRRNVVLTTDKFVPSQLQASLDGFLRRSILPVLLGRSTLAQLNDAMFDYLPALDGMLNSIRPVSVGPDKKITAAEVKEVLEMIILSLLPLINFHGVDANHEFRVASGEMRSIRESLDRQNAAQPEALEVISSFFVRKFCELLSNVMSTAQQGQESDVEKPSAVQYTPRNIFAVLLSELVHHLLLNLPPRLAHEIEQQYAGVLWRSESLLEAATKLVQAEDYFQRCTELRNLIDKFENFRTAAEDRATLLFRIANMQFWRIFAVRDCTRFVDNVYALVDPVLKEESDASAQDQLRALLSAHKVLKIMVTSSSSGQVDSSSSSSSNGRADSSSSSSGGQVDSPSSNGRVESSSLLAIAKSIEPMLKKVEPAQFEEDLDQVQELLKSYIREHVLGAALDVEVARGPWGAVFAALICELLHRTSGAASAAAAAASSSSGGEVVSEDDVDLGDYADVGRAVAAKDLVAVCALLQNHVAAGDDDALAKFATRISNWRNDFEDTYRQRLHYICPFAQSVEAFGLCDDNETPIDDGEVRVYRLNPTGTLLSEFGRRGMGLEPLESYCATAANRFAALDPTNRQKVESYERDRAAERAVWQLFRSLERLTRLADALPGDEWEHDDDEPDSKALHVVVHQTAALARRMVEDFDTSLWSRSF